MSRQGRPLGRSERRWLGYYDFESGPPKLDQFETRDSTTNIPALLKQALDNAEDILRAAREDRVSITQALKTSEAEAVLCPPSANRRDNAIWHFSICLVKDALVG